MNCKGAVLTLVLTVPIMFIELFPYFLCYTARFYAREWGMFPKRSMVNLTLQSFLDSRRSLFTQSSLSEDFESRREVSVSTAS